MEITIQLHSSRKTSNKTNDEQDESIHTLACYSRSHILRPKKNYATHFSTSPCMLYALPIIQYFIKSARFQYHHTQWHKRLAIPSRPTWLREPRYLTPSWTDVRPSIGEGGTGDVPTPHHVTQQTLLLTQFPAHQQQSLNSPRSTAASQYIHTSLAFENHSPTYSFIFLCFILRLVRSSVVCPPSGPALTYFLKDEAKCLET